MSDNLPEDILINILARLSVKTLLRCRCVSKIWFSLITSPSFISYHLKKATTRNNDLLFFTRYKEVRDRYFLYPDKDFPRCHGEELDFPIELTTDVNFTKTHLVGSCNGLFCLFSVYFNGCVSKYAHRAVLWNPSIRKTVPIPEPSVSFQSHGYFAHSLGFGFDSINHDYKLVRIVYLETSHYRNIKETILPPLVEVYSLKSGCWRMVENDLKRVIRRGSRSAFVNGACHWTTVNFQRFASNVIVVFNLVDEKIGEMTIPDCVLFRDDMELIVTVFDGLLSLVALWTRFYRDGHYSIWAMKEYGDAKSWIKLFNIDHLLGQVSDFVGFKKNGEMFLVSNESELTSYSTTKSGSFRIWGTKIWSDSGKFYLDSYVESLVLLDEASSNSTDNSSGNEENGVSKEHSTHVAGLDMNKKEKKKKGKKIMEGPETVDGENRVLEGGASSSGAASRNIVTNEGDGNSKEHDFGAKNRKQKEKKKKKKKNGKNNMESDDEANELPGKHNSSGSVVTDENETHEAPKQQPSSGSNANKKKGTKKKTGNNNKNE